MSATVLATLLLPALWSADAQTACADVKTLTSAEKLAPPKLGFSADNARRLHDQMRRYGFGSAHYNPCARPLAVIVFEGAFTTQDVALEATALAVRKNLLTWGAVSAQLPEAVRTKTSSPTDGDAAAEQLADVIVDLEPEVRRRALASALGMLGEDSQLALTRSLLGRELDAALELGVRDNVVELARTLEANGWDVFFVGWTPDWLMRAVLQPLGFSPLRAIGAQTRWSPSREPVGLVDRSFPSGAGKLFAVRTRIAPGGRTPRIVLGHSTDDEWLFKEAGANGALVIGNSEMLDRAEAAGWMQQ